MEISDETLKIRTQLKSTMDLKINPIDDSLPVIPEFKGKGVIKLIIIGQDPTIQNIYSRKNITRTLNLDKNNALRSYVEGICVLLRITIENVYATNLFKYFYTQPPAETIEILKMHLEPNLALLKQELIEFKNIPVITLGEPVLRLLTHEKNKVRNYWDYNPKGGKTNGIFRLSLATDNKLNRDFYPFPHQPSIRKKFYKDTIDNYVSFMNQYIPFK